jgi:hypothetical protein
MEVNLDNKFKYGPIARYNALIASRNRKVAKGIPLSKRKLILSDLIKTSTVSK